MEIINKDSFEKLLKEDKVLVVDFFATWCRPCSMLAPILDKVASDMPNVAFAKVDVDEEMDLAQNYGILSIPCIIMFKDGKEADRLIGFTTEDELKTAIEKVLN
ncbi:MAG: thioredoxin [Clostridia bacterium]|nr:thioredoxin [Clostridia bacterium]